MRRSIRPQSLGWLVSSLAFLLAVVTPRTAALRQKPGAPSRPAEPLDVGMVALVAVPDTYDGKLIRTVGFLCIEYEGDALYLHQEDYRHGLTKDSLALRLSRAERDRYKNLSLQYVLVEGVVYARGLEREDQWGGAIGSITRLEAWPFDRGPIPH